MNEVATAIQEVRTELAGITGEIFPDTCRLVVRAEIEEYENVPCWLKGGGKMDGAPYRIRFGWNSPAVIGTGVVVDAVPGRPALTLQLVEPRDSSTGVWQEWQATSGPASGRVDVGL